MLLPVGWCSSSLPLRVYMNASIPDRWIDRRVSVEFLTRSPNLTPMNIFSLRIFERQNLQNKNGNNWRLKSCNWRKCSLIPDEMVFYVCSPISSRYVMSTAEHNLVWTHKAKQANYAIFQFQPKGVFFGKESSFCYFSLNFSIKSLNTFFGQHMYHVSFVNSKTK